MTALTDKTTQLFENIIAGAEACDALLPSCRYISHCDPPTDCCDIFVVYPLRVDQNPVSGNINCNIFDPILTFVVELWYCITVPSVGADGFAIPDPAVMTREALEMQDAAYKIYNTVIDVTVDTCSTVQQALLECVAPQGGCAGWKITIQTGL